MVPSLNYNKNRGIYDYFSGVCIICSNLVLDPFYYSSIKHNNSKLSWKQLNRWFGRKDSDAIPFLMRPENRNKLITWFLARVFLCRGCNLLAHRPRHIKGHDVLMLEFEKENIRNEKMFCRNHSPNSGDAPSEAYTQAAEA